MKRYLTTQDYKVICTPEDLEAVSQGLNDLVMSDAESYAADLVASYLRVYARAQFDLAKILVEVHLYEASASYAPGAHVYDAGEVMHVALQQSSGAPLSDLSRFEQADRRLPTAKAWIVSISLYRMHMAIMPGNLPEHRRKSYDDAMAQLRSVSRGEMDCGLPQIENSISLRFGSGKKRQWYA
jgi:hypothetical protein